MAKKYNTVTRQYLLIRSFFLEYTAYLGIVWDLLESSEFLNDLLCSDLGGMGALEGPAEEFGDHECWLVSSLSEDEDEDEYEDDDDPDSETENLLFLFKHLQIPPLE